jgi:(p)ppGpp synthase/HD superfamily hydrolase
MKPFTLDDAIALAVKSHYGQKDKAQQPYILHPIRVMTKQITEATRMAAILHDVMEDCGIRQDDLRKIGVPEMVIEAVDCLTHREGEDYMAMIERIRLNDIATAVKIADLEDNLDIKRVLNRRDLQEKDLARLNKYYKAWTILTGK